MQNDRMRKYAETAMQATSTMRKSKAHPAGKDRQF